MHPPWNKWRKGKRERAVTKTKDCNTYPGTRAASDADLTSCQWLDAELLQQLNLRFGSLPMARGGGCARTFRKFPTKTGENAYTPHDRWRLQPRRPGGGLSHRVWGGETPENRDIKGGGEGVVLWLVVETEWAIKVFMFIGAVCVFFSLTTLFLRLPPNVSMQDEPLPPPAPHKRMDG